MTKEQIELLLNLAARKLAYCLNTVALYSAIPKKNHLVPAWEAKVKVWKDLIDELEKMLYE